MNATQRDKLALPPCAHPPLLSPHSAHPNPSTPHPSGQAWRLQPYQPRKSARCLRRERPCARRWKRTGHRRSVEAAERQWKSGGGPAGGARKANTNAAEAMEVWAAEDGRRGGMEESGRRGWQVEEHTGHLEGGRNDLREGMRRPLRVNQSCAAADKDKRHRAVAENGNRGWRGMVRRTVRGRWRRRGRSRERETRVGSGQGRGRNQQHRSIVVRRGVGADG